MRWKTQNNLQSHAGVLVLMILFGVIYFLILFLNHYYFKTSVFDLGVNNNALFDYTRLQWNDSYLLKNFRQNLLAEHFDLYLIIFSPLALIFGSYTLLIIQLFAILLGGLGIYKYFLLHTGSTRFANAATLYFFLFFGIFTSLLFEYQSYAVAAMIIPWFFYYIKLERFRVASILFILMLISRETTALWVSMICLGMVFNYLKEKRIAKVLIEYFLIAFIYYLLISEFVMPYFSETTDQQDFAYSGVGESYLQSIGWIIGHPVLTFKMLVFNHTYIPGFDYSKIALHVYIILLGGIFLLFRPQYIIMMIPVYFSKLLSDHHDLWGVEGHYTIEFAPILTLGVFDFLSRVWQVSLRRTLTLSLIILSLIITVRVFVQQSNTESYKLKFYDPNLYTNISYAREFHRALNSIPTSATVSSEAGFVPNLAFRDNIYIFPEVNNAEYVVVTRKDSTSNPGNDSALASNEIINSRDWSVKYQKDNFYILRRSDKE